jgi:hypothetical protein
VDRRRTNRSHLDQHDLDTALRQLPRRLASGEAAADDQNSLAH